VEEVGCFRGDDVLRSASKSERGETARISGKGWVTEKKCTKKKIKKYESNGTTKSPTVSHGTEKRSPDARGKLKKEGDETSRSKTIERKLKLRSPSERIRRKRFPTLAGGIRRLREINEETKFCEDRALLPRREGAKGGKTLVKSHAKTAAL